MNVQKLAQHLSVTSALGLSLTISYGCNRSESEKGQVQTSRTQATEALSVCKPDLSAPSVAVPTAPIDAAASASAEKPPTICRPNAVKLNGVSVIPREKWGAKPADLEVLGTMPNCSNFPITKIIIHHTGEAKETTPEQEQMGLLSAQGAHTKLKHWGDFAYHYAVGLSGKIYEGRNPAFRGDSNTQYYPNNKDRSHTPEHHLLITVIGNYELQEMTEATRRSLSQLISANLSRYGLSSNDVISHKDVAYTGCPGKNVIEWLNQRNGRKTPSVITPSAPVLAPELTPK